MSRRTGLITRRRKSKASGFRRSISETINFVPEVGETTLSAYNHVIQSIAKQIVDMMEQPWYNEQDVE